MIVSFTNTSFIVYLIYSTVVQMLIRLFSKKITFIQQEYRLHFKCVKSEFCKHLGH